MSQNTPVQYVSTEKRQLSPMQTSTAFARCSTVNNQKSFYKAGISAHSHIFKPVWSTILLVQPSLAICEPARNTTLALRRIGAIEERNMLIPNISEPIRHPISPFSHFD